MRVCLACLFISLSTYAMDENFIDSSVGKKPFSTTIYEADIVAGPFYIPPAHTVEPVNGVFSINHYIPSGWMGDYGDLRLSNSYTANPSGSPTCLKIIYSGQGAQGMGWAGIYWQNPSNNWGNLPGGYNLRGMRRLTFWARGEEGGEVISVFKIGGIHGAYLDSDMAQIGPVRLTADWRQYTIDLTNVDLSRVIGGFAWATGRANNSGPITFYLDQIRYER